MKTAYIVKGYRTAVGKAKKGSFRFTRPDDLAAQLIQKMLGKFPEIEKYSLVNQLRRSSISIPSNIAEGWGRQSRKNYLQFLRVARGSLFELETQLIITKELKYVNYSEKLDNLISER